MATRTAKSLENAAGKDAAAAPSAKFKHVLSVRAAAKPGWPKQIEQSLSSIARTAG